MAGMNAELIFLLESSKVPSEIIAKFGQLGYNDLDTFAHMEIGPKEVRDMIKTDITLDPAGGPQHRAIVARLLAVWEASKQRASKMQEEEDSLEQVEVVEEDNQVLVVGEDLKEEEPTLI